MTNFFRWLFNWPDRDHHEKRQEMTEQQLFEAWAYGWPTPPESIDKMKAWNHRHSDLLQLSPMGKPSEDLLKMRALYEEQKNISHRR